jgi:phosphoribosyl 1,2-cyclic phosphate phosphodiesterase
MEFTLLGSGTSTGVPVPGCRCAVCTSPDPRNKRERTSGIVRLDDGRGILIDASPDLRSQALRWDVRSVDAVLYTHLHADHILGTDDLRSFNFVHQRRIPCFGTEDTLTGLKHTFAYIFDPAPDYTGGMLAQLDLVPIHGGSPIVILGHEFQTFLLPHCGLHVTGFRLGDLGYATDCKEVPEPARKILRGVKHLFLDGLRYEASRTHLTIPEAVEIAADIGADTTYLIHTTHTVDFDETSQRLPQGVELGVDGLTVPITFPAPSVALITNLQQSHQDYPS